MTVIQGTGLNIKPENRGAVVLLKHVDVKRDLTHKHWRGPSTIQRRTGEQPLYQETQHYGGDDVADIIRRHPLIRGLYHVAVPGTVGGQQQYVVTGDVIIHDRHRWDERDYEVRDGVTVLQCPALSQRVRAFGGVQQTVLTRDPQDLQLKRAGAPRDQA